MIPILELFGLRYLSIALNGTKYEKFRIDKNPYNETWQRMKNILHYRFKG